MEWSSERRRYEGNEQIDKTKDDSLVTDMRVERRRDYAESNHTETVPSAQATHTVLPAGIIAVISSVCFFSSVFTVCLVYSILENVIWKRKRNAYRAIP